MMHSGQNAIDFLTTQIEHGDQGASSHWRLYHNEFHVQKNGKIHGLKGFGGCSEPYGGLRYFAHKVLQSRYRRLGAGFPEFDRLDRIAISITEKQSRAYDLDVLRNTITLAFLKRHLPSLNDQTVVCVIGDGFASMTTLLIASQLAKHVLLVNLTKTLLVDLLYFQKWVGTHSDHTFGLALDDTGFEEPEMWRWEVIAIQAMNHTLLKRASVDLVINIVSMHEMDPPVIAGYFEDMRAVSKRKPLYFYCCNREQKVLPDGTITRFTDYPWDARDNVLVDELCPWHQYYYALRPPFYLPYDGPIRHRLVRMS